MIELRPFARLGGADHGWLKAKHHFSFASYYDDAISISNRYRVRSTGPKGRIVHYRLLEQPNAGKTPVPIDVAAK